MASMAETEKTKSLGARHAGAIMGVFISRCSGVVRTIVVNSVLGAGTSLDAFNTAFRFPNSLRDLFADGALSAAFIKGLIDIKPQGAEAEKYLISTVLGFFSFVTFGLAIIAALFAPEFIRLMSDQRFIASGGMALATQIFQVLIFYLPLTMLNAIMMGILGVRGDTFRAMNGSIFLSVGMIAGVLCAPLFKQYQLLPVWGLTWGAMLGAFLQLIYQSFPMWKDKSLPWPNMNPRRWLHYQPLKQILQLMAPRAIGQGASTLALMVNTFFALQISLGAMTYVATTMIVIQVPIGLFGVATGFAALPVLTETLLRGDIRRFSQLLTESLDTSCWLALFTTIGLAFLMLPVYIVIFQHGAIHFKDTILNCIAISAFSTGIFFGAGSKVLLNTLYAINATRLIVFNSIVYLILSTLLSYLLTPHFGLTGLGLAFGLSSAGNFWMNYAFINSIFKQKYGISPYAEGHRHYTLLYLAASLFVIVIGITGCYVISISWINWGWINHFLHALLFSILSGLVFIALFALLTLLFGPKTLRKQLEKLKRKTR
ncbi:MAG: murein biosynthesis integral membrane protein MurJ [Legionellales bacterium]|nr:murein biosynthesis integral membrane protein MurJ [Legionellales bacterium]